MYYANSCPQCGNFYIEYYYDVSIIELTDKSLIVDTTTGHWICSACKYKFMEIL